MFGLGCLLPSSLIPGMPLAGPCLPVLPEDGDASAEPDRLAMGKDLEFWSQMHRRSIQVRLSKIIL